MRTFLSIGKSGRFAGICVAITCLNILNVAGQGSSAGGTEDAGQHLFVLSGQSNMTHELAEGFSGAVEAAFGKEKVTVAMSMKSGRGIRYWCSDYRYPDNRKPGEQERVDNGSLYKPLMESIKAAAGDKSFDTVTFIWMQGESDASRGWSEVYAEAFLKLLDRLKADMKRDSIRFVIGRISDHNMQSPNWTAMREAQVKLALSHPDGAWIDTDDLNGGKPGVPGGDLHYPKDERRKLGERFAMKAIEQIREKRQPKPSP